MRLKNQLRPGRLDVQSGHRFYTALHDLEHFRHEILDKGLLQNFNPETTSLDTALKDDVALLALGMQYVKHLLLGA